MDAGWTLGGPIYIPKLFNRNKEKLFGFMSQEWNHNIIPGTLHQITVPTAAQRTGDFSQTRDGARQFSDHHDPQAIRTNPQRSLPEQHDSREPLQPVWPGDSELAAAAEHLRPAQLQLSVAGSERSAFLRPDLSRRLQPER